MILSMTIQLEFTPEILKELYYTALGHKLRFFRRWKAQFVTVGIIEKQ